MRGRRLLDPLVQIRNASEQNSDDLHSHFHSCTLGLRLVVNRGMSGIGMWMCMIFSTRGTAFWRQSEMTVAIRRGLERASCTASLRLPRKSRNQLDLVYLNKIES
jgi:hypothetical protein